LISKLKKEKEKMIQKLNFMKKQKERARENINKQFEKSSNFMLDVNELLNQSRTQTLKTRQTCVYK
jgi:hypothetical protein